MAQTLVVTPNKCIACGKCELACSLHHTRSLNPLRGRVKIIKRAEEVGVPVVCLQCDEAACMAVCPVDAISRNPVTEAVVLDQDKCVRCRACVAACPFGNVTLDVTDGKVLKCDLCDGFPMCAVFCPTGALQYKDAEGALLTEEKAASAS